MAIDKDELLAIIDKWNSILNKEKFKIKLVAVGGTALTLLDLKTSTKDIDFTIPPSEDIGKFENLFPKVGISHIGSRRFKTKEGLIIDIYYGGMIFTTVLPDDFLETSKLIKDFGNISLYALSAYDVIISKLARNTVDDEQDIKRIFENCSIDLAKLKERYKQIQELTLDRGIDYHFERLLNVLLKEWGL